MAPTWSTYLSPPAIPACTATADTVEGLSPEITLTVTPCWAKYWKVLGEDADCGIAMASGAEAAAQVAQVVLLDSSFASMTQVG